MKSSKRAFALLMTLIFALSSVFSFSATLAGAADFSDVADTNAYFEAITTLVEDGIINGYEDGTFKPDNTITRAEFSKLLATASAPSGTLFNATTTQFSDVADSTSSSAWAIPYIAYAVGVKAVNGYEDGTFRPTNTVTYGEAVKMIVCTLGYEPVVNKTLTPWYQGYVDIAAQIGLSKSAFAQGDTPAPRGLVAQLVFNMRECKPLVQTGLDINGNPTWGTGDSIKDEYKDGIVLGVIDYALNGASVKKSEVLIGNQTYGIGKYSVDTLKDFVGYSVEFSLDARGDNITNIRKQSGENELITVDADMIASVTDTSIAYYKNEDDEYNNKTTNISIDNMYVVYNGVPVNPAAFGEENDKFNISEYLNVEDGKITFLSNDGNAKDAEVAFVESYKTYLANARPAENNGIWTLYDKFADKTGIAAVNLDEDTTTVKRITSKGGSASSSNLGAITEYDVVSVAMPYGTTENATVIISSVKPTETVQEMNSDYSYVKTNSGEYEVSPYFRTLQDKDVDVSFGNGDSGIFYFDRQGRIAYYK
ncbi:MAG: S-layer homology domain-containing protein, partial [Clostridia bacterium]|nr:S-layer homology domain-containing protein [Clostridia bacterium]